MTLDGSGSYAGVGSRGACTVGEYLWDLDGTIGIADLTALADHYGESVGSIIPEPTRLALTLLAGRLLLKRRRLR